MKTQNSTPFKLDFDTAVEEIRAKENCKKIIQNLEGKYRSIRLELYDSLLKMIEGFNLAFDYLKPNGVSCEVADDFEEICSLCLTPMPCLDKTNAFPSVCFILTNIRLSQSNV